MEELLIKIKEKVKCTVNLSRQRHVLHVYWLFLISKHSVYFGLYKELIFQFYHGAKHYSKSQRKNMEGNAKNALFHTVTAPSIKSTPSIPIANSRDSSFWCFSLLFKPKFL